MASLEQFMDDRLLYGRAYFDREEALATVDLKSAGLTAAITRLVGSVSFFVFEAL